MEKSDLNLRIRVKLKRFLCHILKSRVKQYVVQTNSMRNDFIEWHGGNPTTHIIPIMHVPDASSTKDNTVDNKKYDFVYVAESYCQKWCLS